MIREIVSAAHESIKLGVSESQIASVRSQVEEETAVRVYDDGCIGVASSVGAPDLEALTDQARAGLGFGIPYPAEPSSETVLEAAHLGEARSVDGLVEMTDEVLATLRERFPRYVFGHGVEQVRVGWRIVNDLGLDLRYDRVSTSVALLVKEKGSGSIFDTFVATEGLALSAMEMVARFCDHLQAFDQREGAAPTGRQRIVFPGLEAHAGGGLMQLLRSDMVARSVATGASVFGPFLGGTEPRFSPMLSVADSRDAEAWRVAPFDMEGVVRDVPDVPLVSAGVMGTPLASKRDAARFDLSPTGSGMGELAALPTTGVGHLTLAPTADTLSELLDGEAALMPWFVAGGDCTRTGDLGMPCQVLLRVAPDGSVSGRYSGCTLSGNLYQVLGEDLVGITRQRLDPDSEQPYLLTHMQVGG